jgi:hypothetical protein
MNEKRREVWIEIGSLALALVSLVFLTVTAYLVTIVVAHWMLTGHATIDVGNGIPASWKEQALGIVAVGLPGVALLVGAWGLRGFLGHDESDPAKRMQR